jgi:putative sigma-54 modulation protein
MNIHIHHHDLEMTEALRQYAIEKIGQVEKYIHGKEGADLDVSIGKISKHHKHGDHYNVKVNLKFGSRRVHIDVINSDVYAAIDEAKDKLIGDVTEDKDKRVSILRKLARGVKSALKRQKN